MTHEEEKSRARSSCDVATKLARRLQPWFYGAEARCPGGPYHVGNVRVILPFKDRHGWPASIGVNAVRCVLHVGVNPRLGKREQRMASTIGAEAKKLRPSWCRRWQTVTSWR